MDVELKLDQVKIDLGNNGIFLKIYEPNQGGHVGDLRIGKATVVWMPGKVTEAKGTRIPMDNFIALLNSYRP